MGALFATLCPCAALTAAYNPGAEPQCKPGFNWGFPLPVFSAAGEEEKGSGEKRRSGEEEAAPVTPSVRQDRRPFASAGSRTSRRGRGRSCPRRRES
jgi:hypothetical protein